MSETSLPRVADRPITGSSSRTIVTSPAIVADQIDTQGELSGDAGDEFVLALEAMGDSEARLRLALDAAEMGTFVWRIPEDRYELDRRMLALFSLPPGRTCSRDEIIGLIHPDDRSRYADAFARAIEGQGAGTLREEIRVPQADGSVRWLAVTAQTTVDVVTAAGSRPPANGGCAVQMSGVVLDVTDRKRREANLVLLDQVADDFAHLSSEDEILKAVGVRLGTYLQVSSVCLAEVDEPRDEMRVTHVWNEDGAPSRPEFARLSEYINADFRRAARSGDTLIVHDTKTDPRTDVPAHDELQIRSFIGVPFVRDGAWTFTFAACDTRPRQWRDDEVDLFRRLADRVFARLQHAHAEQAVANDLRDTQLLRDLSVRLVSDSDAQAFFDAIIAGAISITRARAGCLQLLDADTNELILLAYRGFDSQTANRFRRVNIASPTSCGRALAIGAQAVIAFDDPGLPDPDGSVRMILDRGIRSAQSTPLVTRDGRTVGMLSTHWSETHRRLSERELRFLDLLARQAAATIEQRRSDNALRESERRLSAELADTQLLQQLSAQLIEDQGSASLYETLVDAANSIMRSDAATMQMLHPDRGSHGELRLIAARGFDDEAKRTWEWVRHDAHTTCAQAFRTGARVIASDLAHCEFMAGSVDQAMLLAAGMRGAQTTPLVSREGKMLGMITTYWVVPHQPSERDFRLLDILARQAADLIERTQAHEALRRSESQLKEADRRKDEFLATLAHELRNPLAPLRTSLELIRLPDNTPKDVEEVRLMMEEQVGVLVRLVDDLLDVSRITSGKIRLQPRLTQLTPLVTSAVQANKAALEAGHVALSITMPDAPVWLDADPTRFVQVIANVLHNAIKFTDPGGRISISAELALSSDSLARELVLIVADSGVGIPKEILPRVFDLFLQDDATAHRSHTGLGVGLALARRLMEMHGGSIAAHSDGPGLGSAFTLRMPISESIGELAEEAAPARLRIDRRVVVIDDNPAAARSIQRLVTALGGECRVAHNGETGLAHIRELRPDIVILDIGMPRLDGYETCRRIRDEFGPHVLIVALTGWGQERDKQNAMLAGFDVHLTKPADPIMLEQLLASGG